MKSIGVVLSGLALLFASGCASSFSPSPVYIGEKSAALIAPPDRNADGLITQDEWLAAGGMEGKIRPASEQPPPPTPITPPKPYTPVSDLMVRVADIGGEEPITPIDFRSPAGARFVRVEF